MKKKEATPQQPIEEPKTATPKLPAKKKKTGGRQKGVKNKSTAELKTWVSTFVSANLSNFQKKFNELPFEEQFNIMIKFMPYILPKQTETKINLDEELTKAVKDSMDKINSMF